MTHINRFVALSGVLLSVFGTSCMSEMEKELSPVVGGEGYYISLTGEINDGCAGTRAHWDINDDEKQSLDFVWDISTDDMKSFVWRDNTFVSFTNKKNYSVTTVNPIYKDNQAELTITEGLSVEYAEGDIIWAVSPLKDGDIADSKVTFTLPAEGFTQTELNSTEHLKSYVLMSGTGVVGSDKTASLSFDVLPAIYRFKVENKENSELTVNEVSISGPFCDKAELIMESDGTVTYVYSENDTENGYAIKVTTPAEGLTVAAKGTAYLYALVFPTETSSKTDEITLSFSGKYGESPVKMTKSAECNSIYAETNLKSNTYYDMSVPVSYADIEIGDYTKMYLADVPKDDANLTQDVFGVPMLINRTDAYKYRARYYNKEAGTEIYFIPNRDSFSPICIGVDKDDENKLSVAPDAKPIILEDAHLYYEIELNLQDLSYTIETYSVNDATDPINYEYGAVVNIDGYDTTFYIGWGDSPKSAGEHRFVQDKNNPHLFYYPADDSKWYQEVGNMNFIITNYHPNGNWDHVEWRCDKSNDIEKFGYFSKAVDVNPNWEGTNKKWSDGTDVGDNWMKPTITVAGNYRFEFDAHLGRGKIVKVND